MPIKVDLINCADEPIHIPGKIQPHGFLIGVNQDDLKITHVSENIEKFIHLNYQSLLSKSLHELLPEEQINQIKDWQKNKLHPILPHTIRFTHQPASSFLFNALIYHSGNYIILELEPKMGNDQTISGEFYSTAHSIFEKLSEKFQDNTPFQILADELKQVTRYDRVLIYKFDEHWNGSVIAESKEDSVKQSFLNHHFPESDIPAQARALYLSNWVRVIPDVDYQPVNIIAPDKVTLDQSLSPLRSVSPIHIEYLQNMGVKATMVISIVCNNKLWGLISCHHYSPKLFSFPERNNIEFIARYFSNFISIYREKLDVTAFNKLLKIKSELILQSNEQKSLEKGLFKGRVNLLDLIDAEGVAFWDHGKLTKSGNCPSRSNLEALVNWLDKKKVENEFQTRNLSSELPKKMEWDPHFSGLLSIKLSKQQSQYIFWFRPEIIESKSWGGNPHKVFEKSEEGFRLSPRKSFEKYLTMVKDHAQPWSEPEIKIASRLREQIVEILNKNAEDLRLLNEKLEKSIKLKNDILGILAVDLRNPINVILGSNEILKMENKGMLSDSEDKEYYLELIEKSCKRMDGILKDLLDSASMEDGNYQIFPKKVKLNKFLNKILANQKSQAHKKNMVINSRLNATHDTVKIDVEKFSRVINNLISNSIKFSYNNSNIEIETFNRNNQIAIKVIDFGIGMNQKLLEKLFEKFSTVGRKDQKGEQSTGLGMYIIKKIVDLHGGKIKVKSAPQKGTVFTLFLPLST
ncbi:ATP-binding protein [Flexithrix dorotheae]|uniref:ATP-binding protein n=1 Tax=Flexithrix dorotheae TaxID=70993 RepID=UPI00037B659C|nr:ATP-binding protein [Flexithrix dorotheae]